MALGSCLFADSDIGIPTLLPIQFYMIAALARPTTHGVNNEFVCTSRAIARHPGQSG
jgi:hypothetical protein